MIATRAVYKLVEVVELITTKRLLILEGITYKYNFASAFICEQGQGPFVTNLTRHKHLLPTEELLMYYRGFILKTDYHFIAALCVCKKYN